MGGHSSDMAGLGSEETRLNTSSPLPEELESGNASILNAWRGFPRNAPYYLPMISMLAGMVRKNTVSLLLHLMTEWLPQRHVLAAGGPAWELMAAAMPSFGSSSTSSAATASTTTNGGSTAQSRDVSLNSSNALTSSSTSAATEPYNPFSSSPLSLILGEEDSITESFFSFTSFTGRIRNLKLSDQAQLDLVELVVLQVVADVLSLMLSSLTSTRIGLQTLEKLVQISFTLVRSYQPRAIDEDTWKVLQAPVQAQWSVVLGYLGPLLMPIFTTFMTVSFPKLSSDSQSVLLERMHLPLYRAEESNVVAFVMASLPHLMSSKSVALRLIQIDTLDRWLLACDMHEGGPLFDKIKDVFKRLLETPSKNEELEGATNKLLATILAHSPSSFRDKHIDIVLSKTWLKQAWTSKKRDYLECILRVLRGSFLDFNQPSGTVMFPQETTPGTLPTAVIYSPPGVVSSTTISVYHPGGSLASKLGIKPSVLPQALPDANPFATGTFPHSRSSSSSSVPGGNPQPHHARTKTSTNSMFEMHWTKELTLSPYAQCGFAGDREDRMLQRLITINSALFGQKNPLPRLGDQMDICAEIVVQIVAHHIKFGINSVLIPLARGPVYNKMIALHALKRILDPSSGFLSSAYCFQHGGMMGGRRSDDVAPEVHVEEADLKALQALLVELVNESLSFAQRQMKEARREDPMATFPLQPHAQTCYADVELLHELSSKQQLNTIVNSPIKACFERVRQLVMLGGPQTWLARQREVDQHHLVVVDTISKWAANSNIPVGFKASEFNSSSDDSPISALSGALSGEKSDSKSADKADKNSDKSGDKTASTSTITVPLTVAGSTSASASASSTGNARPKWPWMLSSKRKTGAPEKFTLADVAREAVGALDLALASVHVLQPGDELFIGNLLLHHDEDVAQAVSLQLQQAMLTRANLRPVIIKSLCTLTTTLITGAWALYAPSQSRSFTANTAAGVLHAEPNNVLALLAQVLLFVDLWNLASLLKTKSSAKPGQGADSSAAKTAADSAPPPPSLLDELDALAFICLANPAPMIRHTALSLAQSLDALRETFGLPNRGVAWAIRQVEVPLLQRARFAFMKELAQGVDSKVVIKSDTMPLRIEMAASSHHDAFWPHVLAELSHALVDSPSTYQAVCASRFLVSQYTTVWRNIVTASGVATDDRNSALNADFPMLYKLVHILMFATMSVPLYTTAGIPTTLAMFSKTAGWTPNLNNTNTMLHPPTLSPTVMLSQTSSTFRRSAPNSNTANTSNSTMYPTTSTPPQTTIDDIPTDAAALRHADERLSQVVSQSNSYIASLFKSLSHDDHTIIESVCFAASYIHWRSTLVVASHAWKWYQSLSSKAGLSKKRVKARPFLATLFRRLMRHQTQFQWALRTPSPAWIYFVLPLAELSSGNMSAAGAHRGGGGGNMMGGLRDSGDVPKANALPPLPPIYLHLQSATSQRPVGMPSHDNMLQIAQHKSTSIEDGPVGPLLLLLPRIFFEFIADMAPDIISEHSKASSFDAGQYFIDNATMLSRLTAALTDIPMVCCRNGALRQYLSPSQHRDAILSILASGTNSTLLSIASSGGSSGVPSQLSSSSASTSSRDSNMSSSFGSLPETNTPSMFGTLSGASAAAAFSHHHSHSASTSTTSSTSITSVNTGTPDPPLGSASANSGSAANVGHGHSHTPSLVLPSLSSIVNHTSSAPSSGSSSGSGPSGRQFSLSNSAPPIHINWAELTDMLLTWAPVGKAGAGRSSMDQADLTKLVARVKNSTRREERRTHASFFLGNVSQAALSALNWLAQCGLSVPSSVVDKREVASKVLLDWVLPADRTHGLRFLRWLLASHLEVLLPVYIDRAMARERSGSDHSPTTPVTPHSKDSAMFIHAIYDQFLEDAANAPPEDGITHSTRVFFDRHFQLQKERLRYEKSALKKEDKEFTKVIISRAGQLIFLVLLNLSHASALIRTRSFELLYRLGPIAFGHSHSLADYDLAKRFQDLRDAFISRMEGISRDRALEVSQLVSQSCYRYTEDLFAEAFSRFKALNSANRSWALHFLSCWADRCILQPENARAPVLNNDRDMTPWRYFSTDSLLHNLYTKLSLSADTTDKGHGRAPLLAFWTSLSQAKRGSAYGASSRVNQEGDSSADFPTNIPAIVEYLLAKAVLTRTDLAICKLILLELYRTHSAVTCALLVRKLRASVILDNFKHWSGGSKYVVNSTMLTGIGLGVSQFETVGKFAKETLYLHAHGVPSNSSSSSSGDGTTYGSSGASQGSGASSAGSAISIKPLALHNAKHGMVRENSLRDASVDRSAASLAAMSATAAAELHVFEEVPILDASTANTLWASFLGKKSVQTKYSPHAMMRDAAVSVLSDLLIEDVRPALPHMAVIFNYALLRFDHSNAHLLYSALVPIRTLLKDSDRKRAKDLIRTNGILDTLITLLKHSTFKLNWMCEAGANPQQSNETSSSNPSGSHGSVINAPAQSLAHNNPSVPVSATPTATIAVSSTVPNTPPLSRHVSGSANIAQYQLAQGAPHLGVQDALGPNLLAWAAAIKPGYLANIICQCASLLYEPTTKMDWANELIQWIVQSVDSPSTDVPASTKALELCRAVLETSDLHKDWGKNASEPNSPRDSKEFSRTADAGMCLVQDAPDTVGIFQEDDSDFLRVPPSVIGNLQGAFLETLLFYDRALRTSQHASWIASSSLREKLRHQEQITTLRARVEDMLALFTASVPHLEKSSSLIDVLFVGISMMRISPIGFAALFEKGVVLVQHVLADPRFQQHISAAVVEKDSSASTEESTLSGAASALASRLRRHLKGASIWDFSGLLPLVLRGWYCQKTERASAALLDVLIACPHQQLTAPQLDSVHSSAASGKKFYSHVPEGEGKTPHWLNPVMLLVGLLPWLHYSITSLNARKDDEYTTSVSETCTSLCKVIERACDRETLLGGEIDLVPAALMPIRNLLSALANRQTNFGGYYDRAGEAARFVQDVLRRLILLQNLYSPLCLSVGDLLAQIAVEAPVKLSESILFVHEAFRSSAIPYLEEKPATNFRSLDIRACPRFTTEAIGAIYKHMFEVERNPIVTEASFRIGGTPSNDAQARSSVLSIMNALYAYPGGWPQSLIENSDLGIESPRTRRNSTASTTSTEENNDDAVSTHSSTGPHEPIVHPLTRSMQFNAKLELAQQGGLKAAIDALHSTIIKPKGTKKRRGSPVPSVVVVSPGSSASSAASGSLTSRKRKKGHDRTKSVDVSPTSSAAIVVSRRGSKDPSSSSTTTRKHAHSKSTARTGMISSPSGSSIAKSSSKESAGASSGSSSSSPITALKDIKSSSANKPGSNIQIHFERAMTSAPGGSALGSTRASGSSSATDSPHQQHFKQHMMKRNDADAEIVAILDELLANMDDDPYVQQLTTPDELELWRHALMDDDTDIETLLNPPAADEDDEDDDSTSDSDDSDDDGLRDEFFKQFNLDGINLAAFASPRSNNTGASPRDNGDKSDQESAPNSARSSQLGSARSQNTTQSAPNSARAGASARSPRSSAQNASSSVGGGGTSPSGSSNDKKKRRTSSGSSPSAPTGLDLVGGFEMDELSRALAGLSSYQPDVINEGTDEDESGETSSADGADDDDDDEEEEEDSGSSSSDEDDEDRAVLQRERSGTPASRRTSSRRPKSKPVQPSSASSTAGTAEDAESEGSGLESSEDRLRRERKRKEKRLSAGQIVSALPSRERRAFKKRSTQQTSTAAGTVPVSSVSASSSSKTHNEDVYDEESDESATKTKKSKRMSKDFGSPGEQRQTSPSSISRATAKLGTAPSVTPVPSTLPQHRSPGGHTRAPSVPVKPSSSSSSASSSSAGATSSAGLSSKTSSSNSSGLSSRRLNGRGTSSAELGLAGMRKIIDDPKDAGKFLSWMKSNNLDSDVLSLVVAVKEFKQIKDSDTSKRIASAKRIADAYFKPKRGLSTLTEAIRSETYNAFTALDGKAPPSTLFDSAEAYCIDHLTKNHYVMFTKSPFYK